MQKITSVAGLKNAILSLEVEQGIKEQRLKDQFSLTCENLRPVNLLTNTLKNMFSSSNLIENTSDTTLGVASGLLFNRIFIGSSNNKFRKFIGSVLQFGITNIIAQNSYLIKSIGQSIFQHLLRKKKVMNS